MNDNDPESICDRCGHPAPFDDIMDDEHSDHRPVCIDCYNLYLDEKREALSVSAVREQLPEMRAFFRSYWKGPQTNAAIRGKFAGNCYSVAIQLQRWLAKHAPALEVRRVHGHWFGQDVRPARSSFSFQQHGWLVCSPKLCTAIGAGRVIVDPTQFIFTGATPQFAVATNSRYYDEGGGAIRAMSGGNNAPARAGAVSQTVEWPGDLAEWLSSQLFADGRDLKQTTTAELFYIANTPPDALGAHAPAVYAALTAAKLGGLIPLENRERVAGITSMPWTVSTGRKKPTTKAAARLAA